MPNYSGWARIEFEPLEYDVTDLEIPSVEVSNVSGHIESEDFYNVIGSVQNTDTRPLEFVKAFVALYDGDGKILDCDYGYTSAETLAPGQKSVFELFIYHPSLWKLWTYTTSAEGDYADANDARSLEREQNLKARQMNAPRP